MASITHSFGSMHRRDKGIRGRLGANEPFHRHEQLQTHEGFLQRAPRTLLEWGEGFV